MTNQQQTSPLPPPPGYWLLNASRAGQTKAIPKGRTRAAERFVFQVKKGVDALIKPEPNRDKRLAQYRARPDLMWYEQRAKFPDCGAWWDFTHQMRDWARLAPFDPRRDEVIQFVGEMDVYMEMQAVQQGLMATSRPGPVA